MTVAPALASRPARNHRAAGDGLQPGGPWPGGGRPGAGTVTVTGGGDRGGRDDGSPTQTIDVANQGRLQPATAGAVTMDYES